MIDFLKKVFSTEEEASSTGDSGIQTHDARLAVCALFLEMANIDEEFSKKERKMILSVLREEFALPDKYIEELVQAAEEERQNTLDLWRFTDMINRNFSAEEKTRVVELLWRIVYADGKLDKHEDYLVHKISRLLNLKHSQLIEAKLRVLREKG